MSIKVLIADDHQVVRRGLAILLASQGIDVVAEACDGEQAICLAKQHRPDVALIDVRMPNIDGLAAVSRLKVDLPEMPILIFTNYDNPSYAARALALGACGYLLKDAAGVEIVAAVRSAHAGHDLWSRDRLRKITSAFGSPPHQSDSDVSLTRRELEVLQYLSAGLTNKEIAEVLKISAETVKEHVKHILAKIGVADRTQAAVWAVRNKMV